MYLICFISMNRIKRSVYYLIHYFIMNEADMNVAVVLWSECYHGNHVTLN